MSLSSSRSSSLKKTSPQESARGLGEPKSLEKSLSQASGGKKPDILVADNRGSGPKESMKSSRASGDKKKSSSMAKKSKKKKNSEADGEKGEKRNSKAARRSNLSNSQ